MKKRAIQTALLLGTFVGLFLVVGAASAELKANSVFYAWDSAWNEYRNSQVTIYWDGDWVPFLHELNFDTEPVTCDEYGAQTRWAGAMDFGLYHEDNAPIYAEGFLETRDWKLVDCDRNGDGSFTAADRVGVHGGYTETLILSPTSQDFPTLCSTGNCAWEIVTTLEINLDTNCNGNKDGNFPEFVCFYAEGQVPDMSYTPMWSGPLQARITAGGGDKTVSFSPEVPTAVTLLNFGPESEQEYTLSLSVTIALFFTLVLLAGSGFVFYAVRAKRS